MPKIMTTKRFLKKKYKTFSFGGVFLDSFGNPEIGSRWLVYGESGQGKTEFAAQLSKYFTLFGKVLFLSREQGDSSSLQICFARNKFGETNKLKLAIDYDFESLKKVLQEKRPPKVVVIDSIDYMRLTAMQYQELTELFPGMTFIFIAWAANGKPRSASAKAIEYMCDIKIEVRKYVAFPRSRYGGNEEYIIWADKARQFYPKLNQGYLNDDDE